MSRRNPASQNDRRGKGTVSLAVIREYVSDLPEEQKRILMRQEFKSLKSALSGVNTNRGGSADGLKGFYAEYINSSEDNIGRIYSGIAAREVVVDNNGAADAVIQYPNGGQGRSIQDKCGYDFAQFRKFISGSGGKYDGMILRVNNDNPIFASDNESKLIELKRLAKLHNIKIVKGVPETEVKKVAEIAVVEGGIRKRAGLDATAPLTSELYVDSKQVAYAKREVEEKIRFSDSDYVNRGIKEFTNDHSGREIANSTEVKSLVYHGKELLSGREDFSNASAGMVTDIACVKVEEYITSKIDDQISSSAVKVVEKTASITIEKTNDVVTRELMEKISGNAGKIAVIVAKTGKFFVQCIVGDMTVEQFVESSIKAGCDIANTIIGAEVGSHTGELVGGTIGTLILPGIGTEVGAAIGHFIGEFVGALFGSEFLNICIDYKSKADIFLESQRELAYEIDRHTYRMMGELMEIHKQHEKIIMEALRSMLGGVVISDFGMVNQSLGIVANEFGFQLVFENQDDFDSFMLDDTQGVKIGNAVIE